VNVHIGRRSSRLAALAGAALIALAACQPLKPPGPPPPPPPPHGSQTFAFTGAPQTFTVPDEVTSITIDAFGAEGGGSESGAVGGRGGKASATIAVTPGEILEINVGGQPSPGNPAIGGFNGGGGTGTSICPELCSIAGAGGGASDVRQAGTTLSDRVVIAGGGGGGGGPNPPCTGDGGPGGGTTGDDAGACFTAHGKGGTQLAGGAAGTGGFNGTGGSAGTGGTSASIITNDQNLSYGHTGGGGGGGLFGGGSGAGFAGGAPGDAFTAGGGGGGSGFTPSGTGMTNGVREGHGQVTITW
jgi:glycine rich protein